MNEAHYNLLGSQVHFDYFSVDFDEEHSAFYGGVLNDQVRTQKCNSNVVSYEKNCFFCDSKFYQFTPVSHRWNLCLRPYQRYFPCTKESRTPPQGELVYQIEKTRDGKSFFCSVVLVGHSLGGLIGKALFTLPGFPAAQVVAFFSSSFLLFFIVDPRRLPGCTGPILTFDVAN